MDDFVDYIGAIEVDLDGHQYEIGLRREGNRGIRGVWRCLNCSVTQPTRELKSAEGEAIDLARNELTQHHKKLHLS